MTQRVAIMPGDGIGPEVTAEALRVLQAMAPQAGMHLETEEVPIGGSAYDLAGSPLPDESLERARAADAVLLGAVGGPKWDTLDFALRPEKGLLRLRSELGLFANLRPAQIFGDLVEASTLKREVVEGCDVMVIRELTGGIYFGQPRSITGGAGQRVGLNTMVYSEPEIERIVRMGFEIAGKRSGRLCSVDKANVLEVSVLWRDVAERVKADYPGIELTHMYVDNAAMQLIRSPKQFDTIVTGNLFGDVLSDAAAMITGSIGMLPSASLGSGHAMYEPVHGSAPDIAGQDKANPLAAILSVGMLFRYTFDRPELDERIQAAVVDVLTQARTVDIMAPGRTAVGCRQMGDRVLEALARQPQAIPVAAPT
ncbi:MAG TPA: 3-isopropylmalate dehydrogenase [bacterium]|nr:3-isopropylmalate dehydrogenase [bacterium]